MTEKKSGINISTKSFLTAIIILLVLMIVTYGLTFLIPGGSYERVTVDGSETIVPDSFQYTSGGIALWKWLLSPLLVFTASGSGTVIAIILFLLVIGGTFTSLEQSGVMNYMLQKIVHKYKARKYTLLAVISLFFMAMGSLVGSFEECVPMVPIAIALACSLGWDPLVGLGMSLLAVCCGFASGICNPFTVGVAQELAGLPMFSGLWLRLVAFVIIYGLLILFLIRYAKRIEAHPEKALAFSEGVTAEGGTFTPDAQKEKGLRCFAAIMGFGILLIVCSAFLTFLQDYIMPLIALIFLLAGIISSRASGMKRPVLLRCFGRGAISFSPAIILILMASSIKFTLTEANILDTILYQSTQFIEKLPQGTAVFFIYLLVLVINFFIASGSAKAFLLMPLLAPLADLAGLSRQLTVLAFAFGDGFSNVFYCTNPVLLISLGLAGVSYGKWAKWSGKFQLILLVATAGLLYFGSMVGYA